MRQVVVVAALPGRARLKVAGLWASAERARGIELAVAALRGVRRVQANPASGRVLVEFDPRAIGVEAIARAVASAQPTTQLPARRTGPEEPGLVGQFLRLTVSGVVLGGLFAGRLLAGGALLSAAPPPSASMSWASPSVPSASCRPWWAPSSTTRAP
ncbi:MAG: heavy-metal-associated domain-containing protein [Chloroflexi bacterium]|nr:heavy-metal-associated domain-containing protein [Chloroflexota bacterium]